MKATQWYRHWFACMVTACLLAANNSNAQQSQPPQNFGEYWREHFLQDMKDLDSLISEQANGEDTGESRLGKKIKKMSEHRKLFYPYGDITMPFKADSMEAEHFGIAGKNANCANVNWEPVGPVGDPEAWDNYPSSPLYHANKNGRVDCIAFKSGDPNILYVGTGSGVPSIGGGGGLWKVNATTFDAVHLNTDKLSLHNGVSAVVSVPGRLVIATGSSYVNVYYSSWEPACRGVYYSDDEGQSWQKATVTNKNNQDPFQYKTDYEYMNYVSRIVANPANPNIMYMTLYNLKVIYDSNPENFGGLYKSTDKGVTWTEVNDPTLDNRFFQDIKWHPTDANTIYLSGHKVYKSVNGGSSWADVTGFLTGLPALPSGGDHYPWQFYRLFLTVPADGCAASDANHVAIYASTGQAVSNHKIYHSTDALSSNVASTIQPQDLSLPDWVTPFHGGFTMTHDPAILYVAGKIFQQSTDGGASIATTYPYWGRYHPDYQQIAVPPFTGNNAGVVYACSDGGLWKSTDFGQTFTSMNKDFMVNQFFGLGVSQSDNTVIGGTQDNHDLRMRSDNTWKALGVGDGTRYNPINPNDPELYAWGDGSNAPGSVAYTTRDPQGLLYTDNLNTTSWGGKPFIYQHDEPNTLLCVVEKLYRVTNGVSTTGNTFKSSLSAQDQLKFASTNYGVFIQYCYSNPNVIYVATRGQWRDGNGNLAGYDPNIDYNDANGYTTFNFFRSNDGGATWSSLPTNLTGVSGEISSIAVHPTDPDKVWITWGGFGTKNGANQNVYFSSNGGQSWTNYSSGLPLGSTKDIIYQVGSNDRLFLAMDNGIYYREAGMSSWDCFDTGFPWTSVTDLDINYCLGKLYASTFGRGIWRTDLDANSTPPNNQLVEITSNTTWSKDRSIAAGVHVSNGATLTINNTGNVQTVIRMPKNGKIVVEPGAKLVVNGARITNSCESCMWYGIQAVGQSGQPQIASKQGTVEITNGAVIEHARYAVSNDGGFNGSNTGGIIRAENSYFINNKKAVQFHSYRNYILINNVKVTKPDVSYFRKCTFDANSEYKGDDINYPFDCHISMWEVQGIRIEGCKFYNRSSLSRGYGILTYDAGFSAGPHCTAYTNTGCAGTLTRSEFRGFTAGVMIDGSAASFAATVHQADFDSNSIGVKVNNYNEAQILGNNFTIGNGAPIEVTECYQNLGTYTTGSVRFRIEENTYTGITHAGQQPGWENMGAVTENTYGLWDNEIYKNTFSDLKYAAHAVGINSAFTAGLRYFCNDFSNDLVDIAISSSLPDGIATDQVITQGWTKISAGNTFSNTGNNISHTGHSIWYYHDGNNVPTPISWNANPLDNVYLFTADQANECRSKLGTGGNPAGLSSTAKASMQAQKDDGRQLLIAQTAALVELMDGGNTEALIADISNMGALEAQARLLTLSPFVSETTLRYVIDNTLMSPDLIKEVLIANPDVLRADGFMSYLEEQQFDINELQEPALIITDRTSYELELSQHRQEISEAYRLLIASAKSGLEFEDLDEVEELLTEEGSLASAYEIIDFYDATGRISNGDALYASIATNYVLTPAQTEAHDAYGQIRGIRNTIKENQLTALSNDQISTLEGLASDYAGQRIGYSAEATLQAYDRNRVRRLCVQPQQAMKSTPKAAPVRKQAKEVTAFPNPAKDHVVFRYDIPEATAGLRLIVTDVSGKKVYDQQLKENKGLAHWRNGDLKNGIYFYVVRDNKRSYGNGKVVIMK